MSKTINIIGKSPFGASSGVYEAQIAITADKPSNESIEAQTFDSLWKDDFHLNVSKGNFSEFIIDFSKEMPFFYGLFTIMFAIILGVGAAFIRRFISNFRKKLLVKS